VSERRDRFRNLEKRRQTGPAEPAPAASGRFEAVEAPGEALRPEVPEASGDRFRRPLERSPEVEVRSAEEQPFVRCARCEVDNSVYAAACAQCQADLNTPEQRAYNERLWAERRAEAKREAAEVAERQQERERQRTEEEKARIAYASELARQVGQQERRRLDAESGAAGWGSRRWGKGRLSWTGGGPPLGWTLLRLIEDPWMRGVAVMLLVAVPSVLAIFARGPARGAGILLLLVVAGLLLLPTGNVEPPGP
jgi:hypothetical protein